MTEMLMQVGWDSEAVFVERPNRFLGIVDIGGSEEKAHVHDPGRLKELLYPGNKVLLKRAQRQDRKTAWGLIAAQHQGRWIFTNSAYHSSLARKLLESEYGPITDIASIRPEVNFGSSRLDFLITRNDGSQVVIEVKGCTLTMDGKAVFPDAPTERGRRHVKELVELTHKGYQAMLLVLVLGPPAVCFRPNHNTDPGFADAFNDAIKQGVQVYAAKIDYIKDGGWLNFCNYIPVCGH